VEVNVYERFGLGLLGAGAFLAALAVPSLASAQEITGFELGGRVGYGIPLGKTADDNDSDLNEGISGQIPLWLDLGYRVTPNLMVGGYFSYGFGMLGDDFEDGCELLNSDCGVADMRLGFQLQYHVQPGQSVDPWVGAGVGYEWLRVSVSPDGIDADSTGSIHGFEFLNLQAGLDFPVGPGGGIGPFLAFTLGQYDTISSSCDGSACGTDDEDSEEVDDKALHQWLFLGVRGTFVLGSN
jgi:hypothetical protein